MSNLRAYFMILAGALAAAVPSAAAQEYPTKPVRLIIPFPPGGSNDVVGRMVALHLGERLGQQIVVDNRGGAGGTIGTAMAAKASPDGYTLLMISIAHAVAPGLYKLTYDSIKDFTPISILATGPNVLALNPGVPANSVKELIALAKQKPGSLNYASAGLGSFQHLGGELFRLMAGINVVHVPFRGGGPSMMDVIAGNTQFMLGSLIQTVPHIQSGKLKALATGGDKRSPALPDLPTIAEAGVPGYEATNWWGIVGPAGTPPQVVAKLHKEIAAVLKSPEIEKQFVAQGASAVHMSTAEFTKFIGSEITKWVRVVKEAGIKIE